MSDEFDKSWVKKSVDEAIRLKNPVVKAEFDIEVQNIKDRLEENKQHFSTRIDDVISRIGSFETYLKNNKHICINEGEIDSLENRTNDNSKSVSSIYKFIAGIFFSIILSLGGVFFFFFNYSSEIADSINTNINKIESINDDILEIKNDVDRIVEEEILDKKTSVKNE